eukprot:scaffold23812_cov91-Skeletonema_marinoi.AAC.3
MANYDGSLEAVDCHIHSVRYDMAVNRGVGGHLRCFIRCFYTIMANYDGSLEAVDCHIHSVRYDMAVNRGVGGHLRCLIKSPTTL